ncbi:MAG: hypothetical protein MK219_04180, partial [Candidatus Poseidoniia archaeon]|nr:hypothetical protein [Candidatus Poseidoniia archaeon]
LGMGEFCRTWMHNGLIEDADGKLSKSRGERLTLATIFDECPPAALRLYLLQYHYHDFTPFSETALKQACAEGEQLGWTAAEVLTSSSERDSRGDTQLVKGEQVTAALLTRFEACMDDDLDTPQAIAILRELDALAREQIDSGSEIGAVAALYRVFQRALGVFQWPV